MADAEFERFGRWENQKRVSILKVFYLKILILKGISIPRFVKSGGYQADIYILYMSNTKNSLLKEPLNVSRLNLSFKATIIYKKKNLKGVWK